MCNFIGLNFDVDTKDFIKNFDKQYCYDQYEQYQQLRKERKSTDFSAYSMSTRFSVIKNTFILFFSNRYFKN